jgi:hypothetical protein
VPFLTKKKKLAPWVLDIVSELDKGISRDSFIDKLVEKGKETKSKKTKDRMRNVYRGLKSDQKYWIKLKRRIARERGWIIFETIEREDIPPRLIPERNDGKHCYKCQGTLYPDIHIRCVKCNWLICSYDGSCGCGFEFQRARVDFM